MAQIDPESFRMGTYDGDIVYGWSNYDYSRKIEKLWKEKVSLLTNYDKDANGRKKNERLRYLGDNINLQAYIKHYKDPEVEIMRLWDIKCVLLGKKYELREIDEWSVQMLKKLNEYKPLNDYIKNRLTIKRIEEKQFDKDQKEESAEDYIVDDIKVAAFESHFDKNWDRIRIHERHRARRGFEERFLLWNKYYDGELSKEGKLQDSKLTEKETICLELLRNNFEKTAYVNCYIPREENFLLWKMKRLLMNKEYDEGEKMSKEYKEILQAMRDRKALDDYIKINILHQFDEEVADENEVALQSFNSNKKYGRRSNSSTTTMRSSWQQQQQQQPLTLDVISDALYGDLDDLMDYVHQQDELIAQQNERIESLTRQFNRMTRGGGGNSRRNYYRMTTRGGGNFRRNYDY